MSSRPADALLQYQQTVVLRYQLYNSLFTSLPFQKIEKTGILLSLLSAECQEGFDRGETVDRIIESFFERQPQYASEKERIDLLFRFVQYVERQVVLFDALEDAAVASLNDLEGAGTLKQLEIQAKNLPDREKFVELLQRFHVRLVLTAHPTQFYPGPVLGIINDLSRALADDDLPLISTYLEQLGRTPFFKKEKPTPYDEAISLVWYLENVFYQAATGIAEELKREFPQAMDVNPAVLKMGFWPGGDRDGNPFVTYETTVRVAAALRTAVLRCYYRDIRRLKRRLTFSGIDKNLASIEKKLNTAIYQPDESDLTLDEFTGSVDALIESLRRDHNGLFIEQVESLQRSIRIFGFHFATLDIRQDSGHHEEVIAELSGHADFASLEESRKLEIVRELGPATGELSPRAEETLNSIRAVAEIQKRNGSCGCQRYIISHCRSVSDVLTVAALFRAAGVSLLEFPVDIVPLFETVADLEAAAGVMQELYVDPVYSEHLARRSMHQTIMMGFSDGTKDGGYLMANYGIFKAKQRLTDASRQHNVNAIFFDGRGGPPARGGGKTHKFYSSMGPDIATEQIELTIQGQTVSSKFGTLESAAYNAEQLIHAGLFNELVADRGPTLSTDEDRLIDELSKISYDCYLALKSDSRFADYLSETSPLRFYGQTNIGSRPAKRKKAAALKLEDLRAIPFVGAWSQMKQNVPGYYGVGTAIESLCEAGREEEIRLLYSNSTFFRALLDNCEMAMKKCDFRLTRHLESDPDFGSLWSQMKVEYEKSKAAVLRISGKPELMSDYPVERESIGVRERMVQPITTIQQYALLRLRQPELNGERKDAFEKLVIRCSFGIINAGRNSA